MLPILPVLQVTQVELLILLFLLVYLGDAADSSSSSGGTPRDSGGTVDSPSTDFSGSYGEAIGHIKTTKI